MNKTKTTTISRTKAIELIENSGGKFMSITCDTKEKKNRVFNCIYHSSTKVGHAKVKERGQGIKSADLRTLSLLKTGGRTFKIK